MDPWRPVQRSFYNNWGEGQGYVDIFVHSALTVVERQRVGRAHVVLYRQNNSFMTHAPPYVNNERFLAPPIRESWIEDLQAFISFEQTVAGQAIAAHIRSVPHLRDFVQGYFINVIANEARDAACTAVSLQHRAVWRVVDLNFTIYFSYSSIGDDNNAGDDDDDDDGSYLDEVDTEGGDAEVDTVAPEEVGVDAEVQQLAATEGVGVDAEVQQLAAPEGLGADVEPEGVGADAEVQQLAAPEGVVGDAAVVEAGNGDIVLDGEVGDPPAVPEGYFDLETLLTLIGGPPVGPFLE